MSDIPIENLEISIDAAAAEQLELSARHGSQTQQVIDNLHTEATEMESNFRGAVTDFGNVTDEFVDAEAADWDRVVGSVAREMKLMNQSTLNRIESQQAATQNYMDIMAAQLPLLEARMDGLVAQRGGVGGSPSSEGSLYDNPLLQDLLNRGLCIEDTTTEQVTDDRLDREDPYRDVRKKILTDAEKRQFSLIWGVDDSVWGNDYQSGAAAFAEDSNMLNYFDTSIAEAYDLKEGAFEETMNRLQDPATSPWYIDKFTAHFNSMVDSGLDPTFAHDQLLKDITKELLDDPQYQNMRHHDRPAWQQIVRDLNMVGAYNLNFTKFIAGEPLDYSDHRGFGNPSGRNIFSHYTTGIGESLIDETKIYEFDEQGKYVLDEEGQPKLLDEETKAAMDRMNKHRRTALDAYEIEEDIDRLLGTLGMDRPSAHPQQDRDIPDYDLGGKSPEGPAVLWTEELEKAVHDTEVYQGVEERGEGLFNAAGIEAMENHTQWAEIASLLHNDAPTWKGASEEKGDRGFDMYRPTPSVSRGKGSGRQGSSEYADALIKQEQASQDKKRYELQEKIKKDREARVNNTNADWAASISAFLGGKGVR